VDKAGAPEEIQHASRIAIDKTSSLRLHHLVQARRFVVRRHDMHFDENDGGDGPRGRFDHKS
jgi:hypothetical protein